MEFFEYPKRVDDDRVVNSREEEIEYLKSKGMVIDDKKDKEGMQGCVAQGEEIAVGILKRKPGRPKRT